MYTGTWGKKETQLIELVFPDFNIEICKQIIAGLSLFTIEMLALLLVLKWAEGVRHLRAVGVICSDSSLSLTSLKYSQQTRCLSRDTELTKNGIYVDTGIHVPQESKEIK